MTFDEIDWIKEFQGKTLKAVRCKRDGDNPQPFVHVMFDDGSLYEISVHKDIYFEAVLYNAVRKAQPVERVVFLDRRPRWIIEVRAHNFPLFVLRAVDKIGYNRNPYVLIKLRDAA